MADHQPTPHFTPCTAEPAVNLAPFNPISDQAGDKVLALLHLSNDDILFDLGAGDGRLLIKAVQLFDNIRCIGIEIDPKLVDRAKALIESSLTPEQQKRIQMRLGDALEHAVQGQEAECQQQQHDANITNNNSNNNQCNNLSLLDDATCVYLFLLPKGLVHVQALLERIVQQRRSLRVVTYMFQLRATGGALWKPTTVDRNTKAASPVYLYEFNVKQK
jgi:hypothetical protein